MYGHPAYAYQHPGADPYAAAQGYQAQTSPYHHPHHPQASPYGPPMGHSPYPSPGGAGGYPSMMQYQQQASYPGYASAQHPMHHKQPGGVSGAGPPAPNSASDSGGMSSWKSTSAPDGRMYYYNETTGETSWEKPMG